MRRLVRYWNAAWFASRLIFYCNADFSQVYPVNFWDEFYWFILWGTGLYATYVWRHLLKLTNLSTETIRTSRAELFKGGFLFVSLILWEIFNCTNYQAAQSGLTQTIMLFIAGALIIWIVISGEK